MKNVLSNLYAAGARSSSSSSSRADSTLSVILYSIKLTYIVSDQNISVTARSHSQNFADSIYMFKNGNTCQSKLFENLYSPYNDSIIEKEQ